ncbi:RNA polymerase sigma factor SigX [Bacillus lacus]|uniref:RNA polymerase sigma factor SigX n=1 Tax=Metabacillus lacus TaxID=1983721 RepID=A0A7X2IYK4_9BACI|nr:RNA polymerase sigma factor SigX [Metabacillus lacus]MRX72056.1 RNA polymerase sigma factor SigX [Metabacillus lacus]
METLFNRLYSSYHQNVYQFLYYMVKDRVQAEDLSQEVYIRVLKSYDKFEGRSSEKTWILSIARHVAIDWLRKQSTVKKRVMDSFDWDRRQIKDAAPLPEEIAVRGEQVQWIYNALHACSNDQRAVIVLRYIEQLSIAETSEALGWTESKVKTTQHRALKAIKHHLSEQGQMLNEAAK